MRRHVSILCHAAVHDSTQWHAVAAHLSIVAHQLLAAVMETKFFLGFEPAVGEACLRLQTIVNIRVHQN